MVNASLQLLIKGDASAPPSALRCLWVLHLMPAPFRSYHWNMELLSVCSQGHPKIHPGSFLRESSQIESQGQFQPSAGRAWRVCHSQRPGWLSTLLPVRAALLLSAHPAMMTDCPVEEEAWTLFLSLDEEERGSYRLQSGQPCVSETHERFVISAQEISPAPGPF